MTGEVAGSRFETSVCERGESHACDVILGGLFGVGDPPGYVVIAAVLLLDGLLLDWLLRRRRRSRCGRVKVISIVVKRGCSSFRCSDE